MTTVDDKARELAKKCNAAATLLLANDNNQLSRAEVGGLLREAATLLSRAGDATAGEADEAVARGRKSASRMFHEWAIETHAAPPTAAQERKAVAYLTIEWFRGDKGVTNFDFDYLDNDLPPGRYALYTDPVNIGVVDEAMVERAWNAWNKVYGGPGNEGTEMPAIRAALVAAIGQKEGK